MVQPLESFIKIKKRKLHCHNICLKAFFVIEKHSLFFAFITTGIIGDFFAYGHSTIFLEKYDSYASVADMPVSAVFSMGIFH